MNARMIAIATAVLSLAAATAQAQQSPLQVRVRAVNIDSANKDTTGLGLTINDKTIPEVDISYYITPNIAAELILTYPQKHKLYSSVEGGQIGTLKHLPPTLSLQYHFNPEGTFRPYVGAGLNYTRFSGVHFAPAAVTKYNPSIKRNSFGLSIQAGADYMLDKNWSINLDVKKVQIDTEVYASGKKVGDFKVNPLLVGVGVGYRF